MKNARGFGTIDVLFALGIMGLMIGAYARQETENYSHNRAESIANSVSSVMDASKFYIGNNYNALLSHLDVGQTMEIPLINNPTFMGIGDLATNSALLPSGFTGKVAKGQTIHLVLKHIAPTAGKPDYISGMVMTTGGANLTDREVGLAVNDMGLSGGGVMSRPPIGHASNSIYGGYGTWSYPISQWQASGVTPSVGHIAMVTDSFALPTGDYLSRYNGSNPEGIRLHTDLDMGNGEDGMSGNQINGVHAIFGANNQDIRLQDTYHSGRVNFGNGGTACVNDSMGCHFDIGTKGGFYDNEDGWISFQNNSPTLGLKNKSTTNVLGATLDNDILTRDGVSYSFSAGGAPGQGQDAALTYNGQWINATGGSGFSGITTDVMQAKRFQDRADNSYYFIPYQLSRLNELQFAGQVATNGYEFKGGVHTQDLYADSIISTGNSGGRVSTALMANGNGFIGGNTTVNGSIHAQGNVSTDGLDGSNPQAWDALGRGGIHTSALKSNGGSIFIGSNYNGYSGSGLLNLSKVEVSGIAKASVFRTMGFRPISGASCSNNVQSHTPYTNQIIGTTLGGNARDNTPTTYQFGDIASDASGRPLSCVNGVWKPVDNALFSTFNGCNTINQWTNTSGQPEFVSAYSNTVNNDSDTLSMTLVAPTGQTYLVSSSNDPSDGGLKRYSVDGFVPNGWSAHLDSTIGVAGVCHWGGDVPGTNNPTNLPDANNPTQLPDIPNAPDPQPWNVATFTWVWNYSSNNGYNITLTTDTGKTASLFCEFSMGGGGRGGGGGAQSTLTQGFLSNGTDNWSAYAAQYQNNVAWSKIIFKVLPCCNPNPYLADISEYVDSVRVNSSDTPNQLIDRCQAIRGILSINKVITKAASGNTTATWSELAFEGHSSVQFSDATTYKSIGNVGSLPIGDILALFSNGVIDPIDDRLVR